MPAFAGMTTTLGFTLLRHTRLDRASIAVMAAIFFTGSVVRPTWIPAFAGMTAACGPDPLQQHVDLLYGVTPGLTGCPSPGGFCLFHEPCPSCHGACLCMMASNSAEASKAASHAANASQDCCANQPGSVWAY